MPKIHRLPWDDFPDVIVHTTAAKLKRHPDYLQAKARIAHAGIRLATDLVKAEKIVLPDVDAIVPVFQTDREHKNAISISVAAILAERLRLQLFSTITQTNDVGHTGANAASRILTQPILCRRDSPGSACSYCR